MAVNSLELGTIITFYSYKGGVGRTMALANMACLLAQRCAPGGRILAMDWDLEAPGLHRFFAAQVEREENADRPGVMNYFHSMLQVLQERAELPQQLSAKDGPKVLDEVLPLNQFVITDVVPGVDLMKAGRLDRHYRDIVGEFNWVSFYQRYRSVLDAFRDLLAGKYAYCLMDSRTGFTDVGGICTMLMPEKLVTVFTPNRQSLYGALDYLEAVEYRRGSNDLRPLVVFPLPAESNLQRRACGRSGAQRTE